MHKFGTFNISLGANNFGFWESFGFGSHGEISLKLFGKSHIFDENLLHKDSPLVDFLVDKLFDSIWDCLSFLKKILKGILTADCSQSGISYFWDWLHDTFYCIISHFWINYSVVDTSINIDSNIVFGEDQLTVKIDDSWNVNKFHTLFLGLQCE